MEGNGTTAEQAAGPAGLAGKALRQAEAWYYQGATLLWYAYPFLVLAWTVSESTAARGREPSSWRTAFGRYCKRRGGRGSAEQKLEQKRGLHAEGAAAAEGACKEPPSWFCSILALLATSARGLRYVAVLLVLASRLVAYALLFLPWFVQIGYAYFHDPRIRRRIRYGSESRNYVDIYFPPDVLAALEKGERKSAPVVVTVMGGAWIIGHRLWNVLLGMRLSQAGVLVVGVDYRNYPFAEMHQMSEDVGRALDWVFADIASYGGDPRSVALVGQSAGAHLEAMVLLKRCMAEARGEAGSSCWSPKDLKGFFGVSGAYDLVALGPHLASRGIYNALPCLCTDGDIRRHSPLHLLATPEWQAVAAEAAARLPPVHLYAGELDQSVPAATSAAFAHALRGAGARHVTFAVGKGVRHAEPVVEDPLTGGDLQIELMLPILPKEVGTKLKTLKPPYPQVPKPLARLGLRLMPF